MNTGGRKIIRFYECRGKEKKEKKLCSFRGSIGKTQSIGGAGNKKYPCTRFKTKENLRSQMAAVGVC